MDVVALAAAAIAVLALLLALALALRLRTVRREQVAVLGADRTDLVAHAAALTEEVRAATARWQGTSERLDGRMGGIEAALLRVFSRQALVRYDAYDELSGQQSCSLALLDVRGDGVVLTSIHHRDQARIYVRRITRGEPEHRLAPEEQDALREALRGSVVAADGAIEGAPAPVVPPAAA